MAPRFQSIREGRSVESLSKAATAIAGFLEDTKEIHVEVGNTIRRTILLEREVGWTDFACQELTSQLQQLLELVELFFSLEEAYGYFENPMFAQAGYGNRVSNLRSEHRELSAELARLCDHAARLHRNGRLLDSTHAIMARFYVFCDRLAEHEFREKELITEAFSVDIGCGD